MWLVRFTCFLDVEVVPELSFAWAAFWNLSFVLVVKSNNYLLIDWWCEWPVEFLACSCDSGSFVMPVLVHADGVIGECLLEGCNWDMNDTIISLNKSNLGLPSCCPEIWFVTEWASILFSTPWISHFKNLWSSIQLYSTKNWVSVSTD